MFQQKLVYLVFLTISIIVPSFPDPARGVRLRLASPRRLSSCNILYLLTRRPLCHRLNNCIQEPEHHEMVVLPDFGTTSISSCNLGRKSWCEFPGHHKHTYVEF